MKAFLLYRDHDVDPRSKPPTNAEDLLQDLELDVLLAAMANGDRFLFDVCQQTLLSSLHDPKEIVFRQQVLRDCLEHPQVVRDLYDLALEALQNVRKIWRGTLSATLLGSSVSWFEVFVPALKNIRRIAEQNKAGFGSEGFRLFFDELTRELCDEYLATVEDQLRTLRFRDGVLLSAQPGRGNKGTNYVLRRPPGDGRSWLRRLVAPDRSGYTFSINDRDIAGSEALGELRGRGITLVANVLTQSADHVRSFLMNLLRELAFYLGCINVHQHLLDRGGPVTFPSPTCVETTVFHSEGLYDAALRLVQEGPVVSNDVDADGRALVMITGANQGGKSTFLRSVGAAQLMMQCGMFVPATSLRANVAQAVFTHFKREEDASMQSGKLDEELARMSAIVDQITPGSMLLSNESFASTNEREGSEIAGQIFEALLDSGIKVVAVTHLFDLANGLFERERARSRFLRAERKADGSRTFRLVTAAPTPSSHGEDVYQQVFGSEPERPRCLDDSATEMPVADGPTP